MGGHFNMLVEWTVDDWAGVGAKIWVWVELIHI
jgi:hypothetical protein